MRFVLDENMSVAVVAVLVQRGHDVLHTRDHLVLGAPDVEVADFVDRQRAVLLTFDLDFRELLSRRPASGDDVETGPAPTRDCKGTTTAPYFPRRMSAS